MKKKKTRIKNQKATTLINLIITSFSEVIRISHTTAVIQTKTMLMKKTSIVLIENSTKKKYRRKNSTLTPNKP